MQKAEIRQAVIGPVMTNVYFVKNKETGELLLVDPADSPERISRQIRSMEGRLTAILLTHGHFDHIMAVPSLREEFGVPVYAYEAEAAMLKNPAINMSGMYYPQGCSFEADRYVKDLDEFTEAGFRIQVYHTPGHTVGGCCYYLPDEGVLFSGDTLFCGSVGRTDFPGGSMREIVDSIHRLIDALPEETEVYPGHEYATTIGAEKRSNPFV